MTGYQSKKAAALDKPLTKEHGFINYAHQLMVKCFNEKYDEHLEKNMTGFQSKKAAAQDKLAEQSEWKCYMFGNTPQDEQGLVYIPRRGKEPNRFVRWMMKVCFACTWVKEKT
jgi:hypothetical protein